MHKAVPNIVVVIIIVVSVILTINVITDLTEEGPPGGLFVVVPLEGLLPSSLAPVGGGGMGLLPGGRGSAILHLLVVEAWHILVGVVVPPVVGVAPPVVVFVVVVVAQGHIYGFGVFDRSPGDRPVRQGLADPRQGVGQAVTLHLI